MSDEKKYRKGSKPLPKMHDTTKEINRKISLLKLSIDGIARDVNETIQISVTALRMKLKGLVGWHECEIKAVSDVVSKKEQEIIAKIKSL